MSSRRSYLSRLDVVSELGRIEDSIAAILVEVVEIKELLCELAKKMGVDVKYICEEVGG